MFFSKRQPEASPVSAAKRPSFDQVFHQEIRFVGRSLRYLGVPDAEVEDACQEVFVVVHRRLAEANGTSLRAWVRQICVHIAQNVRRSARRRPEDTMADIPETESPPSQHEAVEANETRRQLLALLELLTDDQRAVLVLHDIEQLTMAEVSTALGCPLQTAYSRLHAAHSRLQKALTADQGGLGGPSMDGREEITP